MRGSGMSVCGLLYATVSEQTRTHKGKGNYVASVAASASSCNAASVSPAQRYHLQLKEQRQMKNFSQFSYRIDFRSKKGRALLLALDSNVMKTNDMHARRN